jgi:hypothetical protein
MKAGLLKRLLVFGIVWLCLLLLVPFQTIVTRYGGNGGTSETDWNPGFMLLERNRFAIYTDPYTSDAGGIELELNDTVLLVNMAVMAGLAYVLVWRLEVRQRGH